MPETKGRTGAAGIPSFAPRNLFDDDPILIGALESVLTRDVETSLSEHGTYWGSAEIRELARLAEANPPRFLGHDPWGERLDVVEYHPARHALVRRSAETGLGVALHEDESREPGKRHVLRATRLFLAAQTEIAHLSAMSTTSAVLAALTGAGDVGAEWLVRASTRRYDHRHLPVSAKAGVALGFALVERDGTFPGAPTANRVRTTETGEWRLDGRAWFVAAPMNDAMVVAGEGVEGTGLFLVPRFRHDGTVNGIAIERLKPTLGARGEAVAELRFADAEAIPVGRPDQAADLAARATQLLRHDALTAAAGLMRGALARAVHHARHRTIAGEPLFDQPLMARVLADAALDGAAATALAIRIALALDRAENDDREAAYARLVVPAAKYWIAKSAVAVCAEALECLGGNGFAEDQDLARFYRDAPLAGLTAGAGNIMALDVLRLADEAPETFSAAIGAIAVDLDHRSSTESAETIRAAAEACIADQGSARILTEQVALVAAAAALHRFAPRVITEAFTDSRLAGPWRTSHGMLDGRFDAHGIVDYVFPPP
ncbi:MAG: acyl-CoA dehydrogenase family protein [Siculibacillus sp.]|nr:acyl-CoA dehydrogenase family protein [Siculibacillus sp.]